jgi:hypothetical protein
VSRRALVRKFWRGAMMLGVGGLVGTATVSASILAAPNITSVDAPFPVVGFGGAVVLHGNDFTDSVPGDCTSPTDPTIWLHPLDGAPDFSVKADAGHCSQTFLQFTLPSSSSFTGGARIWIADSHASSPTDSQHSSYCTSSCTSLQPLITLPPAATISPAQGQVYTQVTLTGTNLRPPTVADSSDSVTYPGGPSTFANPPFTFTPNNTSGPVNVSFHVHTDAINAGALQLVNVSAGNYSFLAPQVNGVSPSPAVVGQALTITGSNLGHGGSVKYAGGAGGVRDTGAAWSSDSTHIATTVPPGAQPGPITITVSGYGSALPTPTLNINPLINDINPRAASAGGAVAIGGFNFGSSGTVTAGGIGQTVSQWSDRSISFTLNPDTDAGDIVVTRADWVQASGPKLTITPHLTGLESNNLPPGTPVVVDGISLGALQGTAKIGAQDATTQLWSRTSVLVATPTSIKPGTYPLALTSAAGVPSNALSLTIIAGSTPAHGQTPLAPGARPTPNYNLNHEFVKPIKPPSPVDLTLDAEPKKVAAGGIANLTATLKLNGKPVPGAEMKLSMIYSPAADYSFSPDSGITDQDGVFKATVRISKTPGDNIVLAQSGIFGDQDRVQGTGSNKVAGPPSLNENPANGVPLAMLVFGGSAIALVVAGLFVNLRSHGYV